MTKATVLRNKILAAFKPYECETVDCDESLANPKGSTCVYAIIKPSGWTLSITHYHTNKKNSHDFYDVELTFREGVNDKAYRVLYDMVKDLNPRTAQSIGADLSFGQNPPLLKLSELNRENLYATLPNIAKALVEVGTIAQKHNSAMKQDLEALLAEHNKAKQ